MACVLDYSASPSGQTLILPGAPANHLMAIASTKKPFATALFALLAILLFAVSCKKEDNMNSGTAAVDSAVSSTGASATGTTTTETAATTTTASTTATSTSTTGSSVSSTDTMATSATTGTH